MSPLSLVHREKHRYRASSPGLILRSNTEWKAQELETRQDNSGTSPNSVTTLCPCSKSISKYGAHNQRSYVTVKLESEQPIPISPLVSIVESQASCAVYALLKRADEKFVTETAYENPKFAEDLVRDIYQAIENAYSPVSLGVSTENQESIHNHAAYAYIGRDPRGLALPAPDLSKAHPHELARKRENLGSSDPMAAASVPHRSVC